MDAHIALLLTIGCIFSCGVSSAAATFCYGCYTTDPASSCYQLSVPASRDEHLLRCGTDRMTYCVIERHQTADDTFISLHRRCATDREFKLAHNRCEATTVGEKRCLTFCRSALCNNGTGRLYQQVRYWNYDDPDYADYVYDPEQALQHKSVPAQARTAAHTHPATGRAAKVTAEGGACVLLLLATCQAFVFKVAR